jgi:ribosome maturation factor RimP
LKGGGFHLKTAKNVVSLVTPLAEQVAGELGYIVWDIDYVKEGTEWFLRIDIDKDGGVGIDDCEKYSRTIDPLLDELNPIEEQYTLQISSPGLERVIKNDFHLERCLHEEVCVRLYAPLNGFKEYVGELIAYDSDTVTVFVEEKVEIPRKAIGKMNTYFEI